MRSRSSEGSATQLANVVGIAVLEVVAPCGQRPRRIHRSVRSLKKVPIAW